MDETLDTYQTIAEPSPEVLFKDRKSKFFGYAFPVDDENEVKPIVEGLKRKHPSANHFCYAWQLGIEKKLYRANDDGEPKNSSGMPIYGQIQSFGVTNILVVIVRIFGGAKLGVSGLINAYRTTAQMALESVTIERRVIETKMQLDFGYAIMNDVMRVLKKYDTRIVSQRMESECSMTIAMPQSRVDKLYNELEAIYQLKISLI